MNIYDDGRQIDADPVMAAAAILRRARATEDREERTSYEREAYGILHRAAVVCHGCGAYGGEPHANWCDRTAPADLAAYMARASAGNGTRPVGVDRSAAGNAGGKGDDDDDYHGSAALPGQHDQEQQPLASGD